MFERLKKIVLGAPRNIFDPSMYHGISLIAILAWVGLGADGLSSSAYGPDEAFRTLQGHTYLAVVLALVMALTVFIISYAYSRMIEHFPYGGGGYVVAGRLLGPSLGVVSGSALLVDYVLTISVSIASGVDQIASVLPSSLSSFKLMAAAVVIGMMTLINLRGVKESVEILTPIFALFILTHAIFIFGGIGSHLGAVPRVVGEVHHGFQSGLATLGWGGMFVLLMRAYAMGGGTYTGIEAVSNSLQVMREPKVKTAQRTMLYMAVSLAVVSAGIILCYLLFHVTGEKNKTMNAVALERFAGGWKPHGLPLGSLFVFIALASEAGLLLVAAQAGFIDGPRVMANMAVDSWLPHRFAALSNRLTMKNGIFLIGAAALATLFYTHGDITALVTMYSINVFLTFSLTQLGMCRFWIRHHQRYAEWKRSLLLHGVGFLLCLFILLAVIIEKFSEGAWKTLMITSALVALCFWIRRHYGRVEISLKRLENLMSNTLSSSPREAPALNPELPTGVLLVGRYSGLGIHGLLSVEQLFPGHYKNWIFISVGVVDSASMKGIEEVEKISEQTRTDLEQYVRLARSLGWAADYRMGVGVDVLTESEKLCLDVAREFPQSMFFTNKLIFEEERWFHRLLHNETAYQIQRRLQFAGLNSMVLSVRVFADAHTA